jgi:hypothetical protein
MPKKRSKTPKGVSDAVANSQNHNVYFLGKRNGCEVHSDIKQRKLKATLANKLAWYGWGLTASCAVVQMMLSQGEIIKWRVRLLRKRYKMSLKAAKKKSHVVYQNQIDAKNEMYQFWKGFESAKCQKSWTNGKAHLEPSNSSELIVDDSSHVTVCSYAEPNLKSCNVVKLSVPGNKRYCQSKPVCNYAVGGFDSH